MKKVIIACLLLVSLASCSNNSKPKADTAVPMKEITTEAATTTTEIPPATEPATEATTEQELNDLIFSDQGFEVYYKKIESNKIYLYIVNPDEHAHLWTYIKNINVNGIDININPIEGYTPLNTSLTVSHEIPLEVLQKENITRINDLKFDLSIVVGNNLIGTIENYTITR